MTYYIIPMNIEELAICNCEILSCSKITCTKSGAGCNQRRDTTAIDFLRLIIARIAALG